MFRVLEIVTVVLVAAAMALALAHALELPGKMRLRLSGLHPSAGPSERPVA
jgi:hypothetical protein